MVYRGGWVMGGGCRPLRVGECCIAAVSAFLTSVGPPLVTLSSLRPPALKPTISFHRFRLPIYIYRWPASKGLSLYTPTRDIFV